MELLKSSARCKPNRKAAPTKPEIAPTMTERMASSKGLRRPCAESIRRLAHVPFTVIPNLRSSTGTWAWAESRNQLTRKGGGHVPRWESISHPGFSGTAKEGPGCQRRRRSEAEVLRAAKCAALRMAMGGGVGPAARFGQ